MKRLCLFFSLVLIFCLSSCGADANVRDIISEMSASERNAPAGRVYFSSAAPGEDGYISEKLIAALYGDGKVPGTLEVADSFAVRLSSFAIPYEYAVFKAKTPDDTSEIAKLLQKRIDAVKSLAGDADAEIFVSGRFVFLLMTYDNDGMRDAARRALR